MGKQVGVGTGIMLMNSKGQILLGRRHEDPKKADTKLKGEGTWTMPGGKLEYGESFEEGIKRELFEETGITLEKSKLLCVNNDKDERAHFVTMGMFSRYFKGTPKIMEPDTITEWKWFDLDDLPANLYFPSKRVIDNYLKKKFYIKRF